MAKGKIKGPDLKEGNHMSSDKKSGGKAPRKGKIVSPLFGSKEETKGHKNG